MRFRFLSTANSPTFEASLPLSLAPLWFSATSPEELNVVLGTNDLTSSSMEIKEVASIILHKDFKRANMDNDIALLLLASPITLDDLKVPICLPTQHGPATWHECWVAGWGQTNAGM